MSITASLSNALSGLAAASRSAQVVSSNVSNALTEGYARRQVELSPRYVDGTGAGVQIDGVTRVVDETLLREKRLASASSGSANVANEFNTAILNFIGSPEEAGSLTDQIAKFESALLEAASRPDSDARLANVLTTAQALAGKVNDISDGVQTLREDADAQIGLEVNRLNTSLEQISEINAQILRAKANGRDFPALLDQRQSLIDDISELVPIRQIPRENDTVALYTINGALLLDIKPAEFGFVPSAPITPDQTLASGALSGLTLNGNAVQTSGTSSAIAGGTLDGLFNLRDDLAVAVQDNLDEVARDLVLRFEDPTLDPTLLAGDAGLFTDRGAAFTPADVLGLAGRLEVNALADPNQGGAIYRLRDGLGATIAGPVGDATLLNAKAEVLQDLRAPVGGGFSGASKSLSGFAASLTSIAGQSLQASNSTLSFATARLEGLEETFLANGVDSDQELQNLLLIEQAYAANARVIQTADELIQILIRL